jgi:hypothetical protein
MKKLFGLILMMIAFAIGADVKPLVYENIAKDVFGDITDVKFCTDIVK